MLLLMNHTAFSQHPDGSKEVKLFSTPSSPYLQFQSHFGASVDQYIMRILDTTKDYPFVVIEKLETDQRKKYINNPNTGEYYRIFVDYFDELSNSLGDDTSKYHFMMNDYFYFLNKTTKRIRLTKYDENGVEQLYAYLPVIYLQDYFHDFRLSTNDHKYDFENETIFGVKRKLPFIIILFNVNTQEFSDAWLPN